MRGERFLSRPPQTSVSSVSVDSEDLIYSAQDVTRAVTLLLGRAGGQNTAASTFLEAW